MKVALYARVSTEDQARYGLSIDAQQAALREWAERNGHEIVGEYCDAGVSGKKPYNKRPQLLRFMRQLEGGDILVDALVFTKLDRFYRSVKLYYEAVSVLERHNVAWIAIQEDYETATAGGRMKVNIMLSVAENEADRTAERIKTVFERKVELGQPITRSQPLGFRIEGKALVHDENAPAALAVFEHFAVHGNVYAAREMLQESYGIRAPYEAVYRMLRNPLYKGSYRGNDAYCEPIVPLSLWDKVQDDLARRQTRRTPQNHVYLFAGLLVCAECGRKLTGAPGGKDRQRGECYRCPGHLFGRTCGNRRSVREYKLEAVLVEMAEEAAAGQTREVVTEDTRPRVNRAAIQRRLDRLKALFLEGDLELEEYRRRRDELTARLAAAEAPYQPETILVEGDDFREWYEGRSREEKKTFWRQVIDHIEIDGDLNFEVFYCQLPSTNPTPPHGDAEIVLVSHGTM